LSFVEINGGAVWPNLVTHGRRVDLVSSPVVDGFEPGIRWQPDGRKAGTKDDLRRRTATRSSADMTGGRLSTSSDTAGRGLLLADTVRAGSVDGHDESSRRSLIARPVRFKTASTSPKPMSYGPADLIDHGASGVESTSTGRETDGPALGRRINAISPANPPLVRTADLIRARNSFAYVGISIAV